MVSMLCACTCSLKTEFSISSILVSICFCHMACSGNPLECYCARCNTELEEWKELYRGIRDWHHWFPIADVKFVVNTISEKPNCVYICMHLPVHSLWPIHWPHVSLAYAYPVVWADDIVARLQALLHGAGYWLTLAERPHSFHYNIDVHCELFRLIVACHRLLFGMCLLEHDRWFSILRDSHITWN